MNLPGVLRHCTRLAHALAAGVAVVAMLAAPLTVYANDTTDTTDSSDTTDATGNQTENQPKQSIAITQSTPIVTSKSGYRVTAVISNHGQHGHVKRHTAPDHQCVVHLCLAHRYSEFGPENNAPIPTPNELGSVDVPSIPAGGTATVTIEVNANQQTLASIGSWGTETADAVVYRWQSDTRRFAEFSDPIFGWAQHRDNTGHEPDRGHAPTPPAAGRSIIRAISNRIAETTTSSTSTSSKSNSTTRPTSPITPTPATRPKPLIRKPYPYPNRMPIPRDPLGRHSPSTARCK